MLKMKQKTDNQAWHDTMRDIENIVHRDELDALVDKTLADIKAKTAGKKCAYAYSAGKDSIVLSKICELAGITDSMIGVCDLEYPAFLSWIKKNKPKGCEVINTGQDIEWLAKHQAMLFPQSSTLAARWFSIVQHTAQRKYFKDHSLDMLLLGRRKADGNFVGRGDNIYTAKDVTRYSPLSEWRHEDILAFIHYYKLKLPPIYKWHNGYVCGTHPWPARQWTGSTENGWKEVYDIDPSIVEAAAKHIESAAAFLKGVRA